MSKFNHFDVACWVGVITAILLVSTGLYGIYRSASADGKEDYCYVEYVTGPMPVMMYGHRPWRKDRFIGYYTDLPAASAASSLIGCPLTK